MIQRCEYLLKVATTQVPETGDHRLRPKVLSHGEIAMAAALSAQEWPEALRGRLLTFMQDEAIPFHDFDRGVTGTSSGSNVSLCRHLNAAFCALLLGEAARYVGWEQAVDGACDAVRQYLRNACDEAGACYEGLGSGDQVMQFVFLFAHLLRHAGWHDDLLRDEPRLRLIPGAVQAMLLPGGHFTTTNNDAGFRTPASLWWMLLAAREWGRPDYRAVWKAFGGPMWAKLSGDDPRMLEHTDKTLLMTFLLWDKSAPVPPLITSPEPTAFFAEGTGTASFRTSWNRDAILVTLLGGGRSRSCFGHAHADCGHFGIAVGNEFSAIDTGRVQYE